MLFESVLFVLSRALVMNIIGLTLPVILLRAIRCKIEN